MIVKNNPFGFGELNTEYAQFFQGQSFLKTLVADPDVSVNVGNVSFEPACRNDWHIHHDGFQILLVTAGEGWYQEWGQAPRKLRVGDVVVTKDGIKHWHGATRDSWFSHIAITAGTAEWLEPVSAADYDALPKE
ncbi:cupin domain-containing protein [Levilactobacillus bambusae]|uniref:Cupin domain-containing protein n=1 Tax=Levilactobacillus bambusae TaxID=2024736 RepID=A0A2V1N030_9LACO|nr:cupin domain-containing protein [Levilactobacillus bambusae]PWG00599.1 cupin domain-containing protein [Levilactobacillus bambusae]